MPRHPAPCTNKLSAHRIVQGWLDDTAHKFHGTFQQYLAVPTYFVAKVSHLVMPYPRLRPLALTMTRPDT